MSPRPQPITSVKRWLPVNALVRSVNGNRSRSNYDDVIDHFRVTVNPRYEKTETDTWCNIFCIDVMAAMNVVLPYVVTVPGGEPSVLGAPGTREQNCNALAVWLLVHGRRFGWSDVTAEHAQSFANEGKPTLGIWANPTGGHGHVAIVRPGLVVPNGPWCAQAGAFNANSAPAAKCFGVKRVAYWTAP